MPPYIAGLLCLGLGAVAAGQAPTPAAKAAASGGMRERGLTALRERVTEPERLAHAMAVEAIMKAFARAVGAAPEEWGLAGLLHDIDLAETKSTPARHGIVGADLLAGLGFSEAVVGAVRAHDDAAGVPRRAPIDHALYCADQGYWAVRTKRAFEGKLAEACTAAGLTVEDALRLIAEGMSAAPS